VRDWNGECIFSSLPSKQVAQSSFEWCGEEYLQLGQEDGAGCQDRHLLRRAAHVKSLHPSPLSILALANATPPSDPHIILQITKDLCPHRAALFSRCYCFVMTPGILLPQLESEKGKAEVAKERAQKYHYCA